MGFVNNNTGPGTGAFPASIQPMPDKVTGLNKIDYTLHMKMYQEQEQEVMY